MKPKSRLAKTKEIEGIDLMMTAHLQICINDKSLTFVAIDFRVVIFAVAVHTRPTEASTALEATRTTRPRDLISVLFVYWQQLYFD